MRDLRGSITLDESPEGINQYSGAAAGKASAAAVKSDKGKDAEKGYALHMSAAREHTSAAKAATPAVAAWHKAMSLAHAHNGAARKAGRELPYKFGRNFGDNPRPTR